MMVVSYELYIYISLSEKSQRNFPLSFFLSIHVMIVVSDQLYIAMSFEKLERKNKNLNVTNQWRP